jgi:hypothetical protein
MLGQPRCKAFKFGGSGTSDPLQCGSLELRAAHHAHLLALSGAAAFAAASSRLRSVRILVALRRQGGQGHEHRGTRCPLAAREADAPKPTREPPTPKGPVSLGRPTLKPAGLACSATASGAGPAQAQGLPNRADSAGRSGNLRHLGAIRVLVVRVHRRARCRCGCCVQVRREATGVQVAVLGQCQPAQLPVAEFVRGAVEVKGQPLPTDLRPGASRGIRRALYRTRIRSGTARVNVSRKVPTLTRTSLHPRTRHISTTNSGSFGD